MFNDKNLIDVKISESKKILFIEDMLYIVTTRIKAKKNTQVLSGMLSSSFGIMKNYNFYLWCMPASLNDLSEFIEIREKSLKNFDIMDYINKLILFIVLKLSLSSFIYNLFFKLIKDLSKKILNY